MNYGYFDDARREYVITRPDTPAPWANYLGSPDYGAIITNNAGGYSFKKSGANGRILKYVFNSFDSPGRYIYIRDNLSGDYHSVSWGPVFKELSGFKSECRHGTGYSVISSEYKGIWASASYYVPLGAEYEVWYVTVTNKSSADRELSITGYCEFTDDNNYEQDQINLQYSLFITRTLFAGNRLRQLVKGNLSEYDPDGVDERFFGLAGAEISSYCGDRGEFLGAYRDYRNPVCVENGNLGNRLNYNGVSCGALETRLSLKPGETRRLAFILGMKGEAESGDIMGRYADVSVCEEETEALRSYWGERLSHLQVKTPDEAFNSMLNVWHAYNCFITFTWSRAASLIYCGLRNGYGYRDTVQDIQGIIQLEPETAREKLSFMLSAQVHHGGGLPLVKFTHNAGHENTPEDESYVKETGHPAYRADDALWLFPTVYKYIAETGRMDYLEEEIPFADRDSGSVYEHLRRALRFSAEHLGPHGMPAGLYADWNDCLRLGADGESVFVAMQYFHALEIMKVFAEYKNDREYLPWLASEAARMRALIDGCWDSDRFLRGYTEDGLVIGGKGSPEAELWLNPQSWSVISGVADSFQRECAMELVHERLNTPYGAILMDPPFRKHAFEGARAVVFNAGTKENSGIFLQTQGWLILAEALMGHGGRAFEYYLESCPAKQNDIAEIRRLEPYCYGQFTEGLHSENPGRSHIHWLTGTASTVMVACVEGILGLRPDISGLKLSPAIPPEWEGFELTKDFRGCRLNIRVSNPNHRESGVSSLRVNGKLMQGCHIPAEALTETTEIELIM
ncbi:MAG: N,N'-diacetylchitobiose phosphorylase [Oscillospiraceae bacterium]|nr:N,N'-diacetylchitobiose phosphorylase [Oscillospiraceae bacterium]